VLATRHSLNTATASLRRHATLLSSADPAFARRSTPHSRPQRATGCATASALPRAGLPVNSGRRRQDDAMSRSTSSLDLAAHQGRLPAILIVFEFNGSSRYARSGRRPRTRHTLLASWPLPDPPHGGAPLDPRRKIVDRHRVSSALPAIPQSPRQVGLPRASSPAVREPVAHDLGDEKTCQQDGLLGDLERALRFPDFATTVLYLDLKLKGPTTVGVPEGTLRAQRPPRRRGSDPGPGEGELPPSP